MDFLTRHGKCILEQDKNSKTSPLDFVQRGSMVKEDEHNRRLSGHDMLIIFFPYVQTCRKAKIPSLLKPPVKDNFAVFRARKVAFRNKKQKKLQPTKIK